MLRTGSDGTRDIWSVQLRPVVDQMSADEVPRGESADERQLSGHDGSSDDPRELLSVLSRIRWVSTLDPQHLEHSLLRSENSAATHGSDFDTRHSHTHQEILPVVGSETWYQYVELK